MNRISQKSFGRKDLYALAILSFGFVVLLSLNSDLMAQEAVGVIQTTINKMVNILNVIIVGIMAWCGFLLARGDSSAFQRIIYCVIGLVVVNSADALVHFFYR